MNPPARSGARSVKNPQTPRQRIVRIEELTERIQARQAEVDDLHAERDQVIVAARDEDRATFQVIGTAMTTTYQAAHKAYNRAKARLGGS